MSSWKRFRLRHWASGPSVGDPSDLERLTGRAVTLMRSNRILYILALGISALVFVWTGSLYALAVALFFILLGLLLGLGVLITRWCTEVSIGIPVSFAVGSDAAITLSIRKGIPFSAALITFDIACVSAPFRSTEQHLASVALNTRGRREVQIPLDADRYGRTEVLVERCWCEDPLGLFRYPLPWSKYQSCVVYPARYGLATNVKHIPLSRAFGTTYDESRSGSDVDEVFDIREFQAGDHLASVHWKLTSKFDVMMSRQFSLPVDFELIVVSLGALEDDEGNALSVELLNGVASVGEAISSDLLQQGLSHDYALPVKGEFVSVMVDGLEAMSATSELLLGAPLSERYGDAVACLLSSEVSARFTKCILVSAIYDERLWTQLALEMDLSVVLVVRGTGVQEVNGNYDLVVVDTEDANDRERCITL